MIACVVDDHPRLHLAALRWFASLTRCAGVHARDLAVFNAGSDASTDVLRHLESRGVHVSRIEPFDIRSPHCNKINGLRALSAMTRGPATLTDCDVALFDDPRVLAEHDDSLYAKQVDAPNPAIEVLDDVFRQRGLPPAGVEHLLLFPAETTYIGNCNGGLYSASAPLLSDLSKWWAKEAAWLMDRLAMLARWSVHVDQVAMLMAMRANAVNYSPVSIEWNLPVHMVPLLRANAASLGPIRGIHYHDALTPQAMLLPSGIPIVDSAIERVNEAMAAEFACHFPNASFWSWRYAANPELGSGVGSRGGALAGKRQMLKLLAQAICPTSTLDVGCGDGAAVDSIELGNYQGLDVASGTGHRLADGKRLSRRSINESDSAELVICLDVLIHQSDAHRMQWLVRCVCNSARRAAVISGYEEKPSVRSAMVHFHLPLGTLLRCHAPDCLRLPIGQQDGVTTWAVLRPPEVRHPRDICADTLDALPRELLHGTELSALISTAWTSTGFFPNHLPRLWEYPAALRILRERLAAGASVLDVGAGINPLVPLMARLGYTVTTLDPGTPVSALATANEWGYFDYSVFGLGIHSLRMTADCADGAFDAVISISVVEHISAEDRRSMIRAMRARCKAGGFLFVTVDLISGTQLLWNRSEGVEVEPPSRHGTWEDLLGELSDCGFTVEQADLVHLPCHSPVDIGAIIARTAAVPA